MWIEDSERRLAINMDRAKSITVAKRRDGDLSNRYCICIDGTKLGCFFSENDANFVFDRLLVAVNRADCYFCLPKYENDDSLAYTD